MSKRLNNENAYAILEAGETYRFAGYSWTACELVNDGRVAVIQSHGVTHGAWPGFVMSQFGNGNYYSKSIDGQDISGYDNKMKELYVTIKDAENTSASYGKGLFLISKEKAGFTEWGKSGSGNYWAALKAVAENACSFGSPDNYAWLGTVYGSGGAWYVNSNGGVSYNDQSDDYVVAPVFNLDLSKVEIIGDEIIKKAQPASSPFDIDNLNKIKKEIVTSMKIMDVTIKGIKESDEYKMAQAYNQGLRDAMSIFERESDHID